MWFDRKIKVSFLSPEWKIISEKRVLSVPRLEELIFLPEDGKYYKVMNVIHLCDKKTRIFIIIEDFKNIS